MRKISSKPFILIGAFFGAALLISSLGFGQNIFFHLLGASDVIVNFTSASQTINESTGVAAPWPAAYNAWAKRRQIILNGVTGALTNYTMLLKIDSTKIDYTAAGTGGISLRFANDAGTSLPYEIESWDPAGTSYVWVKIPTLAAYPTRTSIWMYYGNAAAASGQTAAAAWDTPFQKVINFNGTSGATIAHGATVPASVGLSTTANNSGAGMTYAPGSTGTGITLDGGDDWIDLGADAGFNIAANSPFTFAISFKTTDASGPLMSFRDLVGNPIVGLHIGWDGASMQSGKINLLIRDDSGGAYLEMVGPTVNDNQWHRLVVSRNAGNTISLYVDGVSYGTGSSAATGGSFTAGLKSLGSERYWVNGAAFNATDRYLAGTIDEFRFATTQFSADWVSANMLAGSDSLALFQAEQTPTQGKAVITVQLSAAPAGPVTIPYTVTGTATAGVDYVALPGSLIISAGNTTGTIDVTVLKDNVTETSETVIVTLGTPTGGSLGNTTVHTVTIVDDPPMPPVAVNDTLNLTSLTPQNIAVLSNDSDPNGDQLTITAVTAPTGGGTAVRNGSVIAYTPPQDFGTSETFTYTITDGNGGFSTATVTVNFNIPFVWTGAVSSAWATGGNWIGGAAPGVSDTVYFNDHCSTNCNPTIAANISVGGIRMNSSYTGTITQPAGFTITTGTAGWTQRAGTFTGGNSAITIGGNTAISGGTFTATTGVTKIAGADYIVTNSPTINANGGTLTFDCTYGKVCAVSAGAATYNDVNFISYYGGYNLGGTTIKVGGNLTAGDYYGASELGQKIDNGKIEAYKNVTVSVSGYRGTAVVELKGNAAGQTVTGIAGRYLPGLKVSAGSNPVTFVNDVGVASGSYTYVSSSSLTVTGSTLTLFCDYAQTCTITPGTVTYNNVTVAGSYTNYDLGGATFNIAGNFTLGDFYPSAGYNSQPVNNGTFVVSGNINVNNQGYRGTAVINSIGASNTTFAVNALAGTPTGTFVINKATATTKVTLTSNVVLLTAGQNLTLTQGILDLAGFNLTIPGTLTVAAGAKVLCNGGIITAGSTSILGEISCGTSLGISWTGATGDGLWSTAGNWTNNNVPAASDVALFNGMCVGANCNVSIASALTVRGVNMTSAYTGTITQGAGITVTVQTAGWTQAAGTFTGGNAAMNVNAALNVSAGTFTATSATLTAGSDFQITGTGTFAANGGTLTFSATSTSAAVTPGSFNYNNVTFGGSFTTQTITGTMKVLGTLTLADTGGGSINTGIVDAKGNVVLSSKGKNGTGKLRVSGSANQSITGASTAKTPNVEIASTGGTVTYVGTINFPSDYIVTSGTIDTATSTVVFNAGSVNQAVTVLSEGYNNVTFNGAGETMTLTGTMTVNGTTTFTQLLSSGAINGGTISAKGAVTLTGSGRYLGTGKLQVSGSTNQTVTGVATAGFMNFEIASTGGTVTYSGQLYFYVGYKYISGTVDAGTSTVRFVTNGPTVNITAGTPTYNNVYFDGYAGTFTLTDTMEVLGTTTIYGSSGSPPPSINTGTLLARGPVTVGGYGAIGTALLKIAGSSNQAVAFGSGNVPQLEIASTGGTVTLSGSGTVYGDVKYTSGTVDATTSTIVMIGAKASTAFTPGSMTFYNLTLNAYNATITMTGTATTTGTLTLYSQSGSPVSTLTGGAFIAKGNMTYAAYGYAGTAPITMNGTTSATLGIGTGTFFTGNLVIDKTGGTKVSLIAPANYTNPSQVLTVSNGTLDLNGYNLVVPGTFTLASGTTLKCNGGTYTYGTFSNSGTLNCPGDPSYDFNWTGAGGNTNWTNAANWQGGIAPSSTTYAIFNNTYCGSTCNATFNSAIGVRGVQIVSPYTGTITQGTGIAMAVGSGGWTQPTGTFVGSDAAITFAGPVSVTGGTFTATSGTMTSNSATASFTSGTTFNHNGGTFAIAATWASSSRTYDLGGQTYNNLSFTGNGTYLLGAAAFKTVGAFSVNIGGYVSQLVGQVDASGDVTVLNHEYPAKFTVHLVGSSNQTITTSGAVEAGATNLGRLIVDKTGGTATSNGNVTLYGLQYIGGSYVPAANLTTSIQHYIGASDCWSLDTIVPGSIAFQNVYLHGCGPRSITGTLNVAKNLEINVGGNAAGVRNGKVQVGGDYTLTFDENYTSSTDIEMVGSTAANVSMAVGQVNPGNLIITKTGGGTVGLATNAVVKNGNSGVTMNSGTLNMLGKNLTIGTGVGTNNQLTLQSGAVINRGGGTLTYEQLNNLGGTIN